MAIKNYQPTSAGMRFRTGLTSDEVTKKVPEKNLRESLKHSGGGKNHGRKHRARQGGGHRRLYRLNRFKRIRRQIPPKVTGIDQKPRRSARYRLPQADR